MSRFGGVGFKIIMDKDLEDAVEFIRIALDQKEKEKAWDIYVSKNVLHKLESFDKIVEKHVKQHAKITNISWKEAEEIGKKAAETFKKKRGG